MRQGLLASGAAASTGTISPVRLRASTALKRNVSTARPASMRAVRMGLAASWAMVWAKSSWRSASRMAARSRIAARATRGHPTDLRTVVRRRHHDLVVGGHPLAADGDSDQLAHEN